MIGKHTVLGVIPARGGSKRLPWKNLRPLVGKPLLEWTLEAARKSEYIDQIVVSTEDPEIFDMACRLGHNPPFYRPKELATDEAPGVAPVLHALEMLPKFDYVVLLQPTSPLRRPSDIDACLKKSVENKGVACLTVGKSSKGPVFFQDLQETGNLKSAVAPGVNHIYVINGAVYAASRQWLFKNKTFLTEETLGLEMPEEVSVDIDTEKDFREAELYLRRGRDL